MLFAAVMVHFTFLSTFTWLNVLSFDIFSEFFFLKKNGKQIDRSFIFYSIYAWGVPFVMVLVGQILDHLKDDLPSNIIKPDFGVLKCWFCK